MTLYKNDFFAGKQLSRLIRRGDASASMKGNVAQISIERIPVDGDGSADVDGRIPFSVDTNASRHAEGIYHRYRRTHY